MKWLKTCSEESVKCAAPWKTKQFGFSFVAAFEQAYKGAMKWRKEICNRADSKFVLLSDPELKTWQAKPKLNNSCALISNLQEFHNVVFKLEIIDNRTSDLGMLHARWG